MDSGAIFSQYSSNVLVLCTKLVYLHVNNTFYYYVWAKPFVEKVWLNNLHKWNSIQIEKYKNIELVLCRFHFISKWKHIFGQNIVLFVRTFLYAEENHLWIELISWLVIHSQRHWIINNLHDVICTFLVKKRKTKVTMNIYNQFIWKGFWPKIFPSWSAVRISKMYEKWSKATFRLQKST